MINKKFSYKSTQGLPGGANELKKFIKGSISVTGYKSDSPDLDNDFNIIPSNRITMQDVEFPVLGIDNLGNEQMMMPGGEYEFPGDYVTELPQMGKGGLTQWFAEDWRDVKTGKKCGRSGKKDKRRSYPACRPSKRVNETTPKTTKEMSSAELAKFKREKTSSKRIDYNHTAKFGGQPGWLDQYQVGGNYAGQDLIKKSGDWYTTQEWDDAIPDSTFENIVEFFDPTGLTSHDDARRAYREWQSSGSTYPSFNQSIDMFGAVPAIGKASKILKGLRSSGPYAKQLVKTAAKSLPLSTLINAYDSAQDEVEDENKRFQDGGVPKRMGVRTNPDGTVSTHLMRAETLDGENWVAFPSLFQNADSSWVDMSQQEDWMPIYEEAKRRGEVIDFGTDKEAALNFGKGSWKKFGNKGGKKFGNKQYGGWLDTYQYGGHSVRSGETFYGIANKYGVDRNDLVQANPNINIDKLQVGQRIALPEQYEGEELMPGYFETKDKSIFGSTVKQPQKAAAPAPKAKPINIEGLKKGIAEAESRSGKLMINPESTATGLYGQRFSELMKAGLYKGTRKQFAKDTAAQNKIFQRRLKEGITSNTGLLQDANDLYEEYAPQIDNFDYSKEDLVALSNFLGRQGTRNYLGYHVRDKKPLSQALPNIYGSKAKQANKTPQQYLNITRKYYKQGGQTNWLENYN